MLKGKHFDGLVLVCTSKCLLHCTSLYVFILTDSGQCDLDIEGEILVLMRLRFQLRLCGLAEWPQCVDCGYSRHTKMTQYKSLEAIATLLVPL